MPAAARVHAGQAMVFALLGADGVAVEAAGAVTELTHRLATGTMLPFKWEPYPYQRRALERYFGADGLPAQTRQVHVWSRRLGKDRGSMELAALASQKRVMNIWHLFPLHKQARVAIWNGVDPMSGTRFLDQTFPADMIARRSDAQMMLEFCNGSTYQMLGSDNYNSVVGSNPGLVIFSEYALSDPLAWAYISPIIRHNGGGAVFISTYRGRNHFYKLVQQVKSDPEWLVSFENVETAKRDDGSPVFARADAEKELVHMDLARWREEYLNEPCTALAGAYLQRQLEAIEESARHAVANLYSDDLPVACAWGWSHGHYVWCALFQQLGDKLHVIAARRWDYMEPSLAAQMLSDTLRFDIDRHVLPAAAGEGVPGGTSEDEFEALFPGRVYLAMPGDFYAGIDSARRLLPRAMFAAEASEYFEALTQFRANAQHINEDDLTSSATPVKDSGYVAALALMSVDDFMLSGEPIKREASSLDWSRRNQRRLHA